MSTNTLIEATFLFSGYLYYELTIVHEPLMHTQF